MLSLLETIGSWLRAIPGPTEHWATILDAWAWPTAFLLVAFWLRDHIAHGVGKLASRLERDNIQIGNFLKITAETEVTTLDQRAVSDRPDAPESEDARIVEGLLEYAGESAEHAGRIVDWIAKRAGPALEPEEFLVEPNFAELRRLAYTEIVEGQANG